jgi:hypothetical protein
MTKQKASAYLLTSLLGLFALAAVPAKADTYTFTDDHCTGTCLPLTDQITVTQNGLNTVNVSVTGSGWDFVSTGAGLTNSFFFNLLGNPTIAVSNLSTGWNLVSTSAGSYAGDGFSGDFDYALNCLGNVGGCTSGGGGGIAPPLSFTVTATNLTVASFHDAGGTSGADTAYFAADVINLANGNTGLVGATGTTSAVPEPISLSLVGGGLLALGLFRKRLSC